MRNEYGLTPFQMKGMLYIQSYFDRTGRLPPASMLAGNLGSSSANSGHALYNELKKRGFIWQEPAPLGSSAPRGARRPGGVLKRVDSAPESAALRASEDPEEMRRLLKHLLVAARPFAHVAGTLPASERDEDMPILTGQRGVPIGGWRKLAGAYNAVAVILEQHLRISRNTEQEAARLARARAQIGDDEVDLR